MVGDTLGVRACGVSVINTVDHTPMAGHLSGLVRVAGPVHDQAMAEDDRCQRLACEVGVHLPVGMDVDDPISAELEEEARQVAEAVCEPLDVQAAVA